MDEREFQKNLFYRRAVQAMHGFDEVPAARVYDEFDRYAGLAAHGLISAKRGLYCKPVDQDIVHIIKLERWRGTYELVWGVSLACVPGDWRAAVKWNSQIKAARLHLRERRSSSGVKLTLSDVLYIDHFHGEIFMLETLRSMWGQLQPVIFDLFAQIETLDGVLALARRQQRSSNPLYSMYLPHPLMVAAFILARLGRMDEAINELKLYSEQRHGDESYDKLEQALQNQKIWRT